MSWGANGFAHTPLTGAAFAAVAASSLLFPDSLASSLLAPKSVTEALVGGGLLYASRQHERQRSSPRFAALLLPAALAGVAGPALLFRLASSPAFLSRGAAPLARALVFASAPLFAAEVPPSGAVYEVAPTDEVARSLLGFPVGFALSDKSLTYAAYFVLALWRGAASLMPAACACLASEALRRMDERYGFGGVGGAVPPPAPAKAVFLLRRGVEVAAKHTLRFVNAAARAAARLLSPAHRPQPQPQPRAAHRQHAGSRRAAAAAAFAAAQQQQPQPQRQGQGQHPGAGHMVQQSLRRRDPRGDGGAASAQPGAAAAAAGDERFVADEGAVESLTALGFARADVLQALAAARGDIQAAANLLVG